jgi:homoserine dehydrogenase
VPFLGTFERRPLAARVRAVTAILNGTSNAVLTAVAKGIGFDTAVSDAQRLGLAEPDPSMDISGRDAAEKLALLIRRFAHLRVTPCSLHIEGIAPVDPIDLRAAQLLGGTIKPIAHASWQAAAVQAFVGPAFLPDAHPLARVSGVTNGIVLHANGASQCYIGPGAGPDVTAVTLLDDICELATERRVRTPPAIGARAAIPRRPAKTAWFVRIPSTPPLTDTSELLGTYGVWCARVLLLDGRLYALTFETTADRVCTAVDAVYAATGSRPLILPALANEELAC